MVQAVCVARTTIVAIKGAAYCVRGGQGGPRTVYALAGRRDREGLASFICRGAVKQRAMTRCRLFIATPASVAVAPSQVAVSH